MAKIQQPRNFKLMEELENVGKFSVISYGTSDRELKLFEGSIFAKNNNIYGLIIYCDENYPITRPTITFNKDNIPNICNADGTIKEAYSSKITWNPTNTYSIGDLLTQLEHSIK